MAFDGLREFFKKPDFGLLILRAGLGAVMVAHGVSYILDGNLESLGSKIAFSGITFGYVYWGFLAAMTHTVGGFLVVVGYLFRPACFLIFLTMVVAVGFHIDKGHDFHVMTSHGLKTGVAFLALCFIGPGKFSMQKS